MAQPTVTVNAPNGLSATLPRTHDADAVRRHFGVYPQGNVLDSTGAIVPNLNSGVPPYRFDINPALLPATTQVYGKRGLEQYTDDEIERENKKRRVNRTGGRAAPTVADSGEFVEIKELKTASLSDKDSKLLYLRQSAKDLITFLESDKGFVEVQGPPGSGKSTVTWLWVCKQGLKGMSIRWMHIDKTYYQYCDFEGKQIYGPYKVSSNEINTVIDNCFADILVIDGLTSGVPTPLLPTVTAWQSRGLSPRKLVIVSSLQLVIKLEEQYILKLAKFTMPSWTLDEYQTAITNDKFYASIQANLCDGDDKDERVLEKYFLAGGSARWMFSFIPTEVEREIQTNLERVDDFTKLSRGLEGSRSDLTINHLTMVDSHNNAFLVSEYVIRQVSERCETQFIRQAATVLFLFRNPSFDGWVMEADFMLQLRLANDKAHPIPFYLHDFQKAPGTRLLLSVAKRQIFDKVNEDIPKITTLQDNTWLLPKKWNQGGYDAVQLLPGNEVRFVQVTRAKKHGLKLKHLAMMLEALEKATYVVKSIEISFIIPSTANAKEFEVPIEGSLKKYKDKIKTTSDGAEFFMYGLERNK